MKQHRVKAGSLHALTMAVLWFAGMVFVRAADYHFGSTPQVFTLTATNTARALGWSPGSFNDDGVGGVYWRGSNSDATYAHFDLSSLSGQLIHGDVSLNFAVDAYYGGNITYGQVSRANAAWSYSPGGGAPGFTALAGSALLNGNYTTGQTATWSITSSTFQGFVDAPSSFHGLVVSAGSGSTAHFSAAPTLAGSYAIGGIQIVGATDWSTATWDGGTNTLSISGSANVAGGKVLISPGMKLSIVDAATLDSGNFSGSITNHGTLSFSSSANQTLGGVMTGSGALSKSGSGTLTAGTDNAFGGNDTTVTVNGGWLDLNGHSQTLASLNGNSSGGVRGGTGLTSVLTLGTGNASSSFGGALSGNLAVVKTGTGTLTLSGSVAPSGIITVEEGILDLSAATPGSGLRINASKLSTVSLPTAPLHKLYINNVKLSPGRWGAPGSVAAGMADFESPVFRGPGVATVAETGMSCMERWKTMKHGFFVHYTWDGISGSMKPDGTRPTSIDETADSFDATGFADDMAAMGVEYVIFTAWHANFFPLFNSSAMEKYHSGRTPNRDMVGDMITAVRAKGIRVLLYTHPWQPVDWSGDYKAKNDNLINDVYAELVDRYGDQIDGLFVDENFWEGNQDEYVDYDRLSHTIRRRNPELVLIHNWGAWSSFSIYTCDMSHRETPPGVDLDGNPWASQSIPVPSTQLVGSEWSATVAKVPTPSTTTARRSAEGIFRTVVLGAGSCTSGGGWIWGAGPYAGDGKWPIGSQTSVGRWEHGVLEAMTGAAAYMAPVAASIKNTYPSTSWLTEPYTNLINLPQGIVATRSTDDTKEYIHVLNPPGAKTLNLPLPADGKVFSNARLMKNNRAVTISRNTRGISLTLGSLDNWETLNTVIVMDVASPGERSMTNNNSPSATYTGSWIYGSGRATTEYGQDVHETSVNGDFVEFAFQGTDIDLIGTCASNRGTADVYIDNVFQQTINLHSASTVFRRTVFSKSSLPRGSHTLKVVKTGGTYLTVDAFRVTEWINSDDPSITYSGNWSSKASPVAIGGEVRETNTDEDTLILSFEGNGVDVIGSKGFGGGNVRYKLNGSFELAVPQSSNFTQDQALIYTSINSQTLGHGMHNLTGWKRHGTWANVDAFRIYKGTSTPALRWGTAGAGGTGNWVVNSGIRWFDGTSNGQWHDFGGTDYAADFGGTAGTVSLGLNVKANRLTFRTTGYLLQNNSLTLNGSAPTITTTSGVTTTFSNPLGGTTGFIKTGPGTLRLTNGATTNTGNTTIREGTLSLVGGGKLYSNLGWASRTIGIHQGAILEVDQWDGNGCLGQLDYGSGNLVINGGTIRFTGNSNGTTEGQGFTIGETGAMLQSDAPAGQRWNINFDSRGSYGIASNSGGMLTLMGSGNGLISKVIPGSGGVTKSGAGTWTLTSNNTYTGDTMVTAGILSLGNGNSPTGLSDSSNVIVNSSARIHLNFTGTDLINQLWLGGIRMPAGVYSAASSALITGPGTLTVTNLPAAGNYGAWSGPFGFDLTGSPGDDDDHDGIANLLEYVLGGNPIQPSSSSILPTAAKTGGDLVFIFRRTTSSASDTMQTFQYSPDLTEWTDVPVIHGGMVSIQSNIPQSGEETVIITVPSGTGSPVFGRLKTMIPSP